MRAVTVVFPTVWFLQAQVSLMSVDLEQVTAGRRFFPTNSSERQHWQLWSKELAVRLVLIEQAHWEAATVTGAVRPVEGLLHWQAKEDEFWAQEQGYEVLQGAWAAWTGG